MLSIAHSFINIPLQKLLGKDLHKTLRFFFFFVVFDFLMRQLWSIVEDSNTFK